MPAQIAVHAVQLQGAQSLTLLHPRSALENAASATPPEPLWTLQTTSSAAAMLTPSNVSELQLAVALVTSTAANTAGVASISDAAILSLVSVPGDFYFRFQTLEVRVVDPSNYITEPAFFPRCLLFLSIAGPVYFSLFPLSLTLSISPSP